MACDSSANAERLSGSFALQTCALTWRARLRPSLIRRLSGNFALQVRLHVPVTALLAPGRRRTERHQLSFDRLAAHLPPCPRLLRRQHLQDALVGAGPLRLSVLRALPGTHPREQGLVLDRADALALLAGQLQLGHHLRVAERRRPLRLPADLAQPGLLIG